MAGVLHAAHLLFVAVLLQLYAKRTHADVTCTAGVFISGTQGRIICNFGKDITKTRPRPNFNIMQYKYDDLIGDGIHAILCNWAGDDVVCNVKGGYSYNKVVTDALVVDIPRVDKSMEGLYVCQLVPHDDVLMHTCQLNVTEGAPVPSHSVTTSTTTTITTTPKDGEEGAVSKDKTGVIIAVVMPIVLLLLVVGVCCFPWLKFVKRGQQETRNSDEPHQDDCAKYILFCKIVRFLKKKRQPGEGSPAEARVIGETESLIDIEKTNAQASPGKGETEELIANTNADNAMCKSENHSSYSKVNEVEGDRKDGVNVDLNVSGGVVGYKGEGKGDKHTPPMLTPRKHTNVTVITPSQASREPEPRQSLNQHATEPGELTTKEEVIPGDNVDGSYVKKVKERVEAEGNGNISTSGQLLRQQPGIHTTHKDVVPDNKPSIKLTEDTSGDTLLSNTKNDEDVGKSENPNACSEIIQTGVDKGENVDVSVGERDGTQPGSHTTEQDVMPDSKPLAKPDLSPTSTTNVPATDASETLLEHERNREREKLQLQLQQARERRQQLERYPQQVERERQQQLERERQQQLERERQQQNQLEKIQRERERQQQLQRERQHKYELQLQKERERQQQLDKKRQQKIEKERQQLEKERQQQLEKERQQQVEKERQQQLEKERQQQVEKERQQQVEKERQQQLEKERQQQVEKERQQQLEKERQQQVEKERQQQLEKERQQQVEKERQQQLEKKRQQELEKERQQQLEKKRKQLEKEHQENLKKNERESQQQLERQYERECLERRHQQQLERERLESERLERERIEREHQQQLQPEHQQQLQRYRQQLQAIENRPPLSMPAYIAGSRGSEPDDTEMEDVYVDDIPDARQQLPVVTSTLEQFNASVTQTDVYANHLLNQASLQSAPNPGEYRSDEGTWLESEDNKMEVVNVDY